VTVLRPVVRLAVVALAAAAAGLVVPLSAPAQAATCSTSSGVSVVVDFHQLGGGVQTACDADGAGEYAETQFTDVGHTLTFVQGQEFVCQIDGAPDTQCVRTPPANAYWSLWWSDGTSGKWTYASSGVGSLKVPAGGYVGFSWQKGTSQVPPGATPTAHGSSSPSTKPTSHPTTSPTHQPSHASSTQPGPTAGPTSSTPTGTTVSGSPSPSHAASSHATRHPAGTSPTASATASASSSQGAAVVQAGGPPDTSAPGSGSGLPGWVAPALVAALFAAAAAVAVVRRKRTGGT
jgi:hypothetical protein